MNVLRFLNLVFCRAGSPDPAAILVPSASAGGISRFDKLKAPSLSRGDSALRLNLANGGVIPRRCECVDCVLSLPRPFAISFREGRA